MNEQRDPGREHEGEAVGKRIRTGTAIAVLVALGYLAVPASPAAAAARPAPGIHANSANPDFAGYGAQGGFKTASANFVVPHIGCPKTGNYQVIPLVALGGSTGGSAAGVDARCVAGTAHYPALFIVNNADTFVPMKISGGDKMFALVKVSTTGTVVTLKDLTHPASKTFTGPGTSITVALIGDSNCVQGKMGCPLEQVPAFTTNAFSNVLLNGANLSQFAPTAFDMVSSGGVLQVQTSPLATNGKGFTESFKHH